MKVPPAKVDPAESNNQFTISVDRTQVVRCCRAYLLVA